MATAKTLTEQEATPTTETKGVADYSIDEIVASAQAAFKAQPEVILGALQFKYKGGKQRFTKVEVKTAIKEFKLKEVK